MDEHAELWANLGSGPTKPPKRAPLVQPPLQQDATAIKGAPGPSISLGQDIKHTAGQVMRGLGEGAWDFVATPLSLARSAQNSPPIAPGGPAETGRQLMALLPRIPGFNAAERFVENQKDQLATFWGESQPGDELTRGAANFVAQGALGAEVNNFIRGAGTSAGIRAKYAKNLPYLSTLPTPTEVGVRSTATWQVASDMLQSANYKAGKLLEDIGKRVTEGRIPSMLDRFIIQQRGLFHGSKDPVGLLVGGPDPTRAVADEVGQAAIRTTPVVKKAIHFGAATVSGAKYPGTYFKVEVNPEMFSGTLKLDTPQKIIAYQRAANKAVREGLSLPVPDVWNSQREAPNVAAMAAQHSAIDARATDRALNALAGARTRRVAVNKALGHVPGSSYLRTRWAFPSDALSLAAGEKQVAIQNPSMVKSLELRYTFDDANGKSYDIPVAKADLVNGRPQSIRFANASMKKHAAMGPMDWDRYVDIVTELQDRAAGMGYKQVGNEGFDRTPSTRIYEPGHKAVKTMDEAPEAPVPTPESNRDPMKIPMIRATQHVEGELLDVQIPYTGPEDAAMILNEHEHGNIQLKPGQKGYLESLLKQLDLER